MKLLRPLSSGFSAPELLKDKIVSSETERSPGIIPYAGLRDLALLDLPFLHEQDQVNRILGISERLANLPRKDMTLNIVDYDGTIYSRFWQLQETLFQDNRGKAGNRIIEEHYGLDKFIEKFYKEDEAVQRILALFYYQNERHKATVLTAGEEKCQLKKCKAIKIGGELNDIRIVDSPLEKPWALLEYILELGYIPSKIIIYEDTTEHFNDHGIALAQLLGCEVVVDHVQLSEDSVVTNQVQSITQKIFLPPNGGLYRKAA